MRIGLLVYPGCMPAGLFAAADIFLAVNRRMGNIVFEPLWITTGGTQVHLGSGPALVMEHSLMVTCDAYIIPGFWAESAADIDRMLEQESLLVNFLRREGRAPQLWAYCMGVAILAAAGSIDEMDATATWWLEKPLRERFVAVQWDFERPVVEDVHTITAAGANGYWALLSTILASRIPPAAQRDVEQALLIPRPDNALTVFRPVEMIGQTDPRIQRLLAYAQTIPASQMNIKVAAGYLFMSTRTLSRKIGDATGVSAGEWLRLIKLRQVACALLSTNDSVKTIGSIIGFTDEASLMRAFKRATGLTISQYRHQYGRPISPFIGNGSNAKSGEAREPLSTA